MGGAPAAGALPIVPPPLISDRPRLSIVITNFNYARFLGRAIDSALGQSAAGVETIVVDDASTDQSREVIRRYGARITPVFLAENRGNAGTFGAGLAASAGQIVLFLDSDDVLDPLAAEAVLGAWTPGIAKVQFYLDAVDAEERPLGFRVPNIPFYGGNPIELLLRYGYYPSPPTSGNAYHRALLERIFPAPPEWRMGIDGLLNAMAPFHGRVVSLPCSLGLYRHHDRNHSEASGVSLAKIRRDLGNEINRESAIRAVATVTHPLSLRIPAHCKGRLLSLKLDPAGHPYKQDRLWRLAFSGIAASWRFPHHRLAKRLLATLGFAALPLFPAPWLARALDPIVVARKRSELLRSWLCRLPGTPAEEPFGSVSDGRSNEPA